MELWVIDRPKGPQGWVTRSNIAIWRDPELLVATISLSQFSTTGALKGPPTKGG